MTATTIDSNRNVQRKTREHEVYSSLGKILLPSTIGVPPRNGSSENRVRDPRMLWAPAISISSKTDQPLITPQYQKKEQRIAEKSELVKLNPKVNTSGDVSHLTRLGSDRTKIPISFLPHKISPSRKPLSIDQKSPGPATYQQYKDYTRVGENSIYTRQPDVRIRPLIGSQIKRRRPQADINEKKTNFKDIKPFWTTIGTRTYDSRLPNAPVSTIHHRFNITMEMEEKNNHLKGTTMPGPAMYPIFNTKTGTMGIHGCTSPGVTISPRYRERTVTSSGVGPAMFERDLLDKEYKNLFKRTPAFSISSRWSPYSHTYTDECSNNFF